LDVKKRFSEEQIIGFLREADAGMAVKDLCRRHGFSEASYYLWRSKFGGMSVSDAKRLKAELRRVTEERDILKKAAVSSTRQCNMINSCTDRSERYGKDGAARHVSSPEARSMATMEGRPVAQRHCPLL